MKVPIPRNKYLKTAEIDDAGLKLTFGKKKKVAVLFVSINPNYWPYLTQMLRDCRKNFLPQHNVDYFVWTDYEKGIKDTHLKALDTFMSMEPKTALSGLLNEFGPFLRLYEQFYAKEIQDLFNGLVKYGLSIKREGLNPPQILSTHAPTQDDVIHIRNLFDSILNIAYTDLERQLADVSVQETGAVPWPAPTLMRYHLFLNEEERLKKYDHIFYLDADMRVVGKVSDEILNNGLLAAEHPMYSLREKYVPPYEPNRKSTAYIKRPGAVVDDNGKPRFKPYYYAGGFQGGKAKPFVAAMKRMKKNIDTDFDRINYTAIWNDESHWNKYLADYRGEITVMPPSYVYPDSLIKEYYEPLWGRSYEPKIITLTKPFSLSSTGAQGVKSLMA